MVEQGPVEEFEHRWGFDPTPAIEQALRDGNYDLEGGTEAARVFLREVLSDPPSTVAALDEGAGQHG